MNESVPVQTRGLSSETSLPDNVSDWFECVRTTSWMGDRNPQVQERLKRISHMRQFESGQSIFLAGEKSDGVYGIVDGTVRIFVPRQNKSDYLAYRAGAGFWFGDLALFAGRPHLVSAYAIRPTKTIFLPKSPLMQMLDTFPDMYRDFIENTYESLGKTFVALTEFTLSTTEKRIASRLLFEYAAQPDPDGWISLNQHELGKMLASSLPTVQRGLHRLAEEGLVEMGYRRIRICDLIRLATLVSEPQALPQEQPGLP